MRIEHSVQKSLLGSWKKNSKKQKNEQIEKTVVVFPCFVKTKALKASYFFRSPCCSLLARTRKKL